MTTIVNPKSAAVTAEILLKIGAVTFNTEKPYHWTSGIISPMYTDNRLLISYPKYWKKILSFYEEIIKEKIGINSVDVFSGTATAGIPHAAALAYKLKKSMIYVRTSKKEHGKENQIEGNLDAGSNVVVIEDLVSTGKSLSGNVQAVRNAKAKVYFCIAITTSTISAYVNTLKELKIKLFSITNVQVVLNTAEKIGYINKDQQKSIEEFLADPPSWGKKKGFI